MTLEVVGAAIAIAALVWGVYTTKRGWVNDIALRRAQFVRGYTKDFYESDSLPRLFLEIDNKRYSFDSTSLGTQAELT